MKSKWKLDWELLTQTSVWIAGIVVGFVLPPILDKVEDQTSLWKLIQFLITFISALFIIISRYKRSRKHLRLWIPIAIITLCAGLYFLNSYDDVRRKCICNYYTDFILIGTDLIDSNDKKVDCEKLVRSVAGKANKIWKEESINKCRKELMFGFIGTVPLFTIAMISILQAVSISTRKNK